MSLKTRLRIAISLLMAAVVSALSILYLHSFLSNEFTRTQAIADSISGQIQGAIRERLERVPAAGPAEDVKRAWRQTVETDAGVATILKRALENWRLISEIYVTSGDGVVLASTVPASVGARSQAAAPIADWKDGSPLNRALRLYFAPENVESRQPLAILGETTPFLTTHVVVSAALLRTELTDPLRNVGWLSLISLLSGVVLAILLPNLVVDPLERLNQRLDLMATGKFAVPQKPKREAKEFAAVYSKLDILGQQFRGAREDVDELRNNVEHLIERMEQAVLLADASGRLMMVGKNAGRLLGVESDGVNGRLLTDLAPAGSELGEVLRETVEQRVAVRDRLVEMDTGGDRRRLSVTCEPLTRAADGRAMGTLIMMRDAETKGKIEEELGVAGRLVALGRLTRGVAHEIKNPLNAITLHLEVLRSRLEDQAPEVDVIAREISRLDRVVKTFLDFNRPVEPQMARMDLGHIVTDLAKLVEPQAAARNIRVEATASPAFMNGDRDLLKQAVLNVMMNAMDAMEGGGELKLSTRRSGGRCELSVSDTGPGIPPEVQDRIFSLYFTTKKQGSGIGLAIAYRFVQLHDGKLEFFSETGKGTTFRFTFPEAVSEPRTTQLAISRSQGA
jgi:PAS domain S-box-containing protein